MKILLSAYACEPWRGSEPDVGFQTMLTLAAEHQVWVLTRSNNLASLRSYLESDDRSANITLVGLDLGRVPLRLKKWGVLGQLWYYDRWQKLAGVRGVELSDQVDFDVAYHITFAAYWMRTGIAVVDLPLILGPIGGGVDPPLSLATELGWRGMLEDVTRVLGRRLMALLPAVRLGPKRASLIFVNNAQTGARIEHLTHGPVRVLPNPTAIKVPGDLGERTPDRRIFFVARLVAWKGAALAIRAMKHVRTPGAQLVLNGDGPDRRRLERLIQRWGLADTVLLEGQVERDLLLRSLGSAGALVHPSLHEEGGNAVAEALSMQVPVVCLNWGGPAVTTTLFPSVQSVAVDVSTPEKTARAMAAALDSMLGSESRRTGVTQKATLDYHATILDAVEEMGARSAGQAEGRLGRPEGGDPPISSGSSL